jgi:AcrR family transcriptional regulator
VPRARYARIGSGTVTDTKPVDAKAAKSEQTRTLILETALRLFQERGYDKTTMRAIAKEAGVSVGNAYYYFESKEHLVQGFYDRIGAEHLEAVRPILERETDLQARLSGVLTSWLDIAAPYHEFAAQFFKNAADPQSPLSPFSEESEPARNQAIRMHREVLAGSKTKVPAELAQILPELMWLSQMGLVLYWVFDRSENSERTRRMAERGAALTTRGILLARFRILRPLVRELHELFDDFLPGMTGPAQEPAPAADPEDGAEVGAGDGTEDAHDGGPGAAAKPRATRRAARTARKAGQ